MSVTEEIQVTELKLLQEYVDIIVDVLQAILKDEPASYEYLTELSQRITTYLQAQYPDYIFYVGKRSSIHSSMPMGIPISPAELTQHLEQQSITKKRCKWCDGILDKVTFKFL